MSETEDFLRGSKLHFVLFFTRQYFTIAPKTIERPPPPLKHRPSSMMLSGAYVSKTVVSYACFALRLFHLPESLCITLATYISLMQHLEPFVELLQKPHAPTFFNEPAFACFNLGFVSLILYLETNLFVTNLQTCTKSKIKKSKIVKKTRKKTFHGCF